jgi:hypothetical protein
LGVFERRIVYCSNGSRAAKSVKLIFDLSEGIPYLAGLLGPLKVKEESQSPHLAKIQGMKRISDPPLPIEVYTIFQNLSLEELRKNSSLFPGKFSFAF